MRRLTTVGIFLLLASSSLYAAPKFSRGTAVDGVVAWQDSLNPNQFFYLPGRVDLILGTTLTNFSVKYWGIGERFLVQDSQGNISSRVGAVVAGRANLDISDSQRAHIIAAISKEFNISNPSLLPVAMKNVKVQPVLATTTLELSKDASDVIFPQQIAFGTSFDYLVGTGNSLFAQYVATSNPDSRGINGNPHFAVNIVGDVEFEGDPWRARVTADLSQVWSQVRTKVSASVSIGWFHIGSAEYSSLVQDLIRTGAIKMEMQEGSLDNEKYGRQIFEATKKVFEQLNTAVANGDGFFKFEPNPQADAIDSSNAGGWWPWSVSINGGYSSSHFTQSIKYDNVIEYKGHFLYPVPSSMVLAVDCNSTTSGMFVDLRDASEPRITQAKIDRFNDRIAKEAAAKNIRLKMLLERLEAGEITSKQYEDIKAIYNTICFTEDGTVSDTMQHDDSEASKGLSFLDGKKTNLGITELKLSQIEDSILKPSIKEKNITPPAK